MHTNLIFLNEFSEVKYRIGKIAVCQDIYRNVNPLIFYQTLAVASSLYPPNVLILIVSRVK
jgi:hypothetical protein